MTTLTPDHIAKIKALPKVELEKYSTLHDVTPRNGDTLRVNHESGSVLRRLTVASVKPRPGGLVLFVTNGPHKRGTVILTTTRCSVDLSDGFKWSGRPEWITVAGPGLMRLPALQRRAIW